MPACAFSSTKPAVLYHGTNSEHEFWQSEDHSVLILRVHSEISCSSHRNDSFVDFHANAEEAAGHVNATLDTTREYKLINGKWHLMYIIPRG